MSASPTTEKRFRDVCASVPVVELGNEFPTLEAGEAAAKLLERVPACLPSA